MRRDGARKLGPRRPWRPPGPCRQGPLLLRATATPNCPPAYHKFDRLPDWCTSPPARHSPQIRAEDGRRVEGVDISPFISNLPGGRATSSFRSDDASGSTSQAANIQVGFENR